MQKINRTVIKVKPTAEKLALLKSIKEALSKIKLPETIQLDSVTVIVDVPLFFDTHLQVIEKQHPDQSEPCADRLKKALIILGIDIKELAKKVPKC